MLFLSSSCIRGNDIITSVKELSKITHNIELTGGTQFSNHIFSRLASVKGELGLIFLLHNYFPPPREHFLLNFADNERKHRDFIDSAIEGVRILGIQYYSIHAGFRKSFYVQNELLFDDGSGRAFKIGDVKESIQWFNNKYPDIKLAIENLYPNNHEDTTFLCTISDIDYLLNQNDQVLLLLDLGHLKISAAYYGFNYYDASEYLINKYHKRIIEIHISENNSSTDDHQAVGKDSSQYQLLYKFRDIIASNKMNIVLEIRNSSIEQIVESYSAFEEMF